MVFVPGNEYRFDVQIKSPMGWIKIDARLVLDGETTFSGSAKLMGMTVALTDCVRTDTHFSFAAAPQLPFGVVRVQIEADVNAETGDVTGIATAPRHKPMEITGRFAG